MRRISAIDANLDIPSKDWRLLSEASDFFDLRISILIFPSESKFFWIGQPWGEMPQGHEQSDYASEKCESKSLMPSLVAPVKSLTLKG